MSIAKEVNSSSAAGRAAAKTNPKTVFFKSAASNFPEQS